MLNAVTFHPPDMRGRWWVVRLLAFLVELTCLFRVVLSIRTGWWGTGRSN